MLGAISEHPTLFSRVNAKPGLTYQTPSKPNLKPPQLLISTNRKIVTARFLLSSQWSEIDPITFAPSDIRHVIAPRARARLRTKGFCCGRSISLAKAAGASVDRRQDDAVQILSTRQLQVRQYVSTLFPVHCARIATDPITRQLPVRTQHRRWQPLWRPRRQTIGRKQHFARSRYVHLESVKNQEGADG